MLNLAFEIGFDHYRYKLPLEIHRFQDFYREDIRHGYEAAKCQQVSRKFPDMYEKKLLCIRDRALIKDLEVTITEDDLCREYEKTKGLCPVTGLPFYFPEFDGANWSVDRVDNTRGYCPDNIVIVSALVNEAKSDLDLSALIKKSLAGKPTKTPLSIQGFFKLTQFYFKRMHLLTPLNFCQLLTNTQSLFDQLVFLQLFNNKNHNSKLFLKQLEKYISKKTIQKAEKLASKRVHHRADIDVEVLYDSPKLYSSVQSFIKVINQHSKEFDPLLMNCLFA